MIESNVTTAIILDPRRAKKDGTYPAKLRITFQRRQKYFGIGYSFTESDFNKIMGDRPRGDFKKLQLRLMAIERKASMIIEGLSPFTFQAFEKHFISRKGDMNNVFTALQAYIDQLNEEGRASTAFSYSNCLSSMKKFVTRKKLVFEDITPEFLRAYEKWMLDQGKSITTVGIYLRSLRTIFNQAINDGAIEKEHYPFGKRKYQIPSSKNTKKALSLAEIQKIISYKAERGSTEERSRDLWVFSYLCNGMNLKDIALLKYENIDGDKLTFVRAKTKRSTRQNLKTIRVHLHPIAKEIIARWGNNSQNLDDYIFPILEKGISPKRELALIRQATKTVNKYMERIGFAVEIDRKVTTYYARHSFSTALKRSGAPIEFISESLGHSNLKTTESYLDSFEDDVRKKYMKELLPVEGDL